MALSFPKDSPYVHSNYYLFSKQMRDYFFTVDDEQGLSRMQAQIDALKTIREQLHTEAKNFLGGDTPEQAWQKIKQGDTMISKIGKEVILDPQAKRALMKKVYAKEEVYQVIDEEKISAQIAKEIDDIVDINELADKISDSLFSQGFGNKSKSAQKEILREMFISQSEVDKILNQHLKGKLRSAQGKINKILKEILNSQIKAENKVQAYDSFISYFKRAVREKAQQLELYSIDTSIVDKYLKKVEDQLSSVLAAEYTSTNASGALGEEIISAVNDNQLLTMLPGGKKTENEFRKELLPSLVTATTWNDPDKMSYSDLVLINENGVRVRAQSKNYTGAYETFIRTDGDVYQHTHLFSKEQLFKDFFQKLERTTNIVGDIDYGYLSYIVANEIWFDQHGSIDRGGNKGFRQDETHTRLFGSDSWLSRALSGAFVNFLGVVVSEGNVISEVSNVFFLIDNNALVPTYELIDNVLSYWEKGQDEMTRIRVVPSKTGVRYKWPSPEEFLEKKANAANGLGPAVYEDPALVKVGQEQGAGIMETLKVQSVNLGINLKTLFTSPWRFDV